MRRRALRPAAALLAAGCLLVPATTWAQGAPADTSLHRFLDTLADSTDRYFGVVAVPVDTAGLDSALAARLAGPWRDPRDRARIALRPLYSFDRVDGSRWGGRAALENRLQRWRLEGDLGYAAGSDAWLGGGEASASFRRRGASWRLWLAGGRRTEGMNRERDEARVATLRALLRGSDRQHYLRRDGWSLGAGAAGSGWRASLEYRDRLESPLAVTTRWNLSRRALAVEDNLAALPGRARELAFSGRARLPGTPFRLAVAKQVSGGALGSDFDYRRARVALGGDLSAGGRVSVVPQWMYGRLLGDPVPQASFFLGGPRTLRSMPREALAGTGIAVARLDLIGVDDLLALARVPHPAMFPIQGGVFAAAGAVWGADPFGGPGSPRDGWPDRDAWHSEAGVALLYRPGMPDEDAYLRLHLAWPVGNHRGGPRWSVAYSRALDLLGAP